MRLTHTVFLLISVFCSFTIAQTADQTAALALYAELAAELPACGLACLVPAFLESTCSLTNTTCTCTDPQLLATSAACITTTCGVVDQLAMAKYDEVNCNREVKDLRPLGMRIAYVFCLMAEFSVILRLWVKIVIMKSFTSDDWAILAAGILNIPFLTIGLLLYDYGIGTDLWDIPTDTVTKIFMYYLIDETIYLAILTLTKTSLVLFLKNIFPGRRFQIACWIIGGINAVWGILIIILSIFQCAPVSFAWEKWTGTETVGSCHNVNAQTYASAGINIALDFAILILPLKELYNLNVSMSKKLQLFFMFSIGLFVSITSIVRLQSLVLFAASTNPTLDWTPATEWTAIETGVGITCACMPAMRHLLGHLFPKQFSPSSKTETKNKEPSTNSKSSSQNRSFKLDKKIRSNEDGFYELDERSVGARDDFSLSERGEMGINRNHTSTPDSQRKIIEAKYSEK